MEQKQKFIDIIFGNPSVLVKNSGSKTSLYIKNRLVAVRDGDKYNFVVEEKVEDPDLDTLYSEVEFCHRGNEKGHIMEFTLKSKRDILSLLCSVYKDVRIISLK